MGPGKLIPFNDVVVNQQDETGLTVHESGDFFTTRNARHLNIKNPDRIDTEESTEEDQLFECPTWMREPFQELSRT